jgi:hypothetical protein
LRTHLLLLSLRRHNHVLLLQHLSERAVLVHAHEDIATTNELLLDVKLGYRGPLGVLLDSCPKSAYTACLVAIHLEHTCSQLLVLQYVERSELVGINTLHAQNLDAGPREAALRSLGGTLHEQNYGRRGDGAVDGGADFIGKKSGLEGCEEACGGERASCAGASSGAEGLRFVRMRDVEASAT